MVLAVHRCNATVKFMVDEAVYEHAKKVGEALLGKPNYSQ